MPYLTPNAPPPNDFVCRRVRIPNNVDFLALVNGALSELVKPYLYEQFGTLTPEETSQYFAEMFLDYIGSDVCMLGMIMPFATATTPPNTLECDGAIYDRADYPDLYDLLHPSLRISDTQFKTPELYGRFVLGGTGDMGFFPAHETGGQEEVTLDVNQMPQHDHETIPHAHSTVPHSHSEIIPVATIVNGGLEAPAASAVPSPSVTGVSGVTVNPETVTVQPRGGSQPHTNMPPFYTLRYCMIAR